MKTVAIIEGFSGGPIHTRNFRKALSQAGFKLVKDRRAADIIVAHSAGIYAIPNDNKASLLVLIAPTYWPGRSLLGRAAHFRKLARRRYLPIYGWRFYIKKRALEFYYFFARHSYMWLGIFNNNRLDKIQKLADDPNKKIIIIRNDEDSFMSPHMSSAFIRPNIKYIELPGIHDDFTVNPEPYVKIIKGAMG